MHWTRRSQYATTVDHADIRGLATTLLVSVRCLPRSKGEDLKPLNAVEAYTIGGRHLVRWTENFLDSRQNKPCPVLGVHGHLLGDSPPEGRRFAGDGDHHLIGVLAAGTELPVPLAQSHLGLPTDVLDTCGEFFPAKLQMAARCGEWHATEDLEGRDHWGQTPGCDLILEFLFQTLEAFGGFR